MTKDKIHKTLEKIAKKFNADEVTITILNRKNKKMNVFKYMKVDKKKNEKTK